MATNEYPSVLRLLADIDFWGQDWDESIDLEVFPGFLDPADTQLWLRAWTGSDAADATRFQVFGQDGTGGYAALYDETGSTPIDEQPVVFLGSEGATGTVAANLSDFLALLAQGIGPCEAVELNGHASPPHPEVVSIQSRLGNAAPASPEELSARAELAAPGFGPYLQSLLS